MPSRFPAHVPATSLLRGLFLASLMMVVGSCGGDSPTDPIDQIDPGEQPEEPVTPNKDQIVAGYLTEIANALSAISQSASAGGLPSARQSKPAGALRNVVDGPPAVTTEDPAACTYDEPNTRWKCPAFTQQNGLVIETWFQFLDLEGKPQKDFDTASTNGIRRVVTKSGVVSSPLYTQNGPVPAVDTVNNVDDLVLAPLKSAGRKLNGTGSLSVVIVPEGQPVGRTTATTKTENFVMAKIGQNVFPVAGTITAQVVSVKTGFAPTNTTQVTTYDGTKIAKLTITFQSGQQRVCTWDMTTSAPPVCTGP